MPSHPAIGPSRANYASDAALWNKELGKVFKQEDAGSLKRALGQVKGWISIPRRSTQDLQAVSRALQGVVAREVHQMGAYMPQELRDEFLAEMKAMIGSIFEGALAAGGADGPSARQVPAQVFRQAILAANQNAQEALIRLERQALEAEHRAAPGDLAPQVMLDARGRVQVVHAAPTLENLVLRGGGAKGVGYGPALQEMEQAGMLSGLRQVVGTSAGALTATCLATGFSAGEFAALSDELGTQRLTCGVEGFGHRYPSVRLAGGGVYSGEGALLELDHATARSVADYLKAHWADRSFQQKLAGLDPAQVARLNMLRNPDLGPQADRTDEMITFADLRLLHQLEPGKFRQLTLTGWDSTLKQETYFNADNSPAMPVALAARISMALPGLFDAVKYDPGDGRSPQPGRLDKLRQALGMGAPTGLRTFKDGGIGSNVPSEAILDGKQWYEMEGVRARTAVLVFDEDGKAHDQISTRQATKPASAWKKFTRWGRRAYNEAFENKNYARDSLQDQIKARDAGVNAYVVFHGDMKTESVKASAARVDHAKRDASLRMLQQVRARTGQACMIEYQTAKDCFAALTTRQRLALAAAGPPDRAKETSSKLFNFKMELFELARKA